MFKSSSQENVGLVALAGKNMCKFTPKGAVAHLLK